jgi:hypothetical protein
MTCGRCSGYQTQDDKKEKTMDCGCGCGGLKKSDAFKAKISLQSALLFFLIANPATYQIMRRVLGGWVASDTGCPTGAGVLLHSLVFGLVVFLLMKVTLPSPY